MNGGIERSNCSVFNLIKPAPLRRVTSNNFIKFNIFPFRRTSEKSMDTRPDRETERGFSDSSGLRGCDGSLLVRTKKTGSLFNKLHLVGRRIF